jgi:hypothetical protein
MTDASTDSPARADVADIAADAAPAGAPKPRAEKNECSQHAAGLILPSSLGAKNISLPFFGNV